MKLLNYFIFLLVLLIVGCSKEENPVNQNPPVEDLKIIPLSIGNKWVYKGSNFDENGNLISFNTWTNEVVKDTLIQNIRWYIYGPPENSIRTNLEDGYWDFYHSLLYYRYPGEIGEDCYWGTIMSVDSSITVSGRQFKCYFYQRMMNVSGVESILETFASPGAGVVFLKEFYKNANNQWYLFYTRELLSSTIN